MNAKAAEVRSPALQRALTHFLNPDHAFIRPCFCPDCRRHFSDLVFPADRVCGVLHRFCEPCASKRAGTR